MLPAEMRVSLLEMDIHHAPVQAKADNESLARQRAETKRKQETLQKKGLQKASDECLNACFLHEKHDTRWKTVRDVSAELKKIEKKTQKIKALKDQINTHVKGLGWKECCAPWSKNAFHLTLNF